MGWVEPRLGEPTAGGVRSGGTDAIACRFLDTACDGQSVFARHAYSCGAGDPYKKTLKAEIDEGERAKGNATTGEPVPPEPTIGS